MYTDSVTSQTKFGKWTLLRREGRKAWCQCECGTRRSIAWSNLTTGKSQSCGCTRNVTLPHVGDQVGEWTVLGANNHHLYCQCSCGTKRWVYAYSVGTDSLSCGHARKNDGRRRAKLRRIWQLMHQRCEVPESVGYKDYGGRGIHVDAAWDQFEPFYTWAVENGYKMLSGLQLDRRNNSGPYAPWNCRWVDSLTNARNKRNTKYVTAFGETKALAEWLEDPRCPVSYSCAWIRLKNGWAPEYALTAPPYSPKHPNLPN